MQSHTVELINERRLYFFSGLGFDVIDQNISKAIQITNFMASTLTY